MEAASLAGFYFVLEHIESMDNIFQSYHFPAVLKEFSIRGYGEDYQIILCFGDGRPKRGRELAHLKVDWIDEAVQEMT